MMDDYVWFEGIAFPTVDTKPENLREIQENFVVNDEDVINLTYPKSGTNWLSEIICLIHSKGDPKWVQSVPNWQRAPWVETGRGYKMLQNREGPRIFTSHLPIQLFPKSFFHSKAKMIYCMRNPRDVLVSGYFFFRRMSIAKKPETLQQYLEWFLQGNVVYGSWFEHIRGWLSRRQCENFLVVSYEELTKDTRSVVEKICQFLGKKLTPEEIDLVLKYSSFHFMKENQMSNFSTLPSEYLKSGFLLQRKVLQLGKKCVVACRADGSTNERIYKGTKADNAEARCSLLPDGRRGVTGDWKNHFTVAQAEEFDEVYQQNMAGFPPKLFPWE